VDHARVLRLIAHSKSHYATPTDDQMDERRRRRGRRAATTRGVFVGFFVLLVRPRRVDASSSSSSSPANGASCRGPTFDAEGDVASTTTTPRGALGGPYSAARAPELRELRLGSSWNRTEGGGKAFADGADEAGVLLRLTAPPWCGSTRAVVIALERAMAKEDAADADTRVLWDRPWRPSGRRGELEGVGAWSTPRAEFQFRGRRVRYGGEWSAGGLVRAARALRRETWGKNETTLELWPFVRLRGKHDVAEFFDNAGTELALVVLDPCKSSKGCASTASMRRLRRAILHRLGYSPKYRLGVLMGADAWRIGTKLLEKFEADDITAVAFVRGALHSVWTDKHGKEGSISKWVASVSEATSATIVRRGFFSLSKFTPSPGVKRLAMIFANEANEDLDVLGARVHQLVESSHLNATASVVDTSRGVWLLCEFTGLCEEAAQSELDSQVRVALVDVDEDSIHTVDVSPLETLRDARPFTRSSVKAPKTPANTRAPRVPHITRNQLDHKMSQIMSMRQTGTFSILYASSACAFCQRFLSLLNAALASMDAHALVVDGNTARVFQIDCALNDCHERWNASKQSLVARVRRYPTLVTYSGKTGSSIVYQGPLDAKAISSFLSD